MLKQLKKITIELSLTGSRNYFLVFSYIVLAILEGITDGLGVGLLTSFITNLSQDTKNSILMMQQTYSFLPDFIFSSIKTVSFYIISLFLFRIIVVMISANFKCILPQMLLYRVRKRILEKTFSLSLFDLEQKRTGKIINLLALDASKMSQSLFAIIDLIYLIVLVGMYLLIMTLINYMIFLIGLLIAFPFILGIRFLIKILTRLSKNLLEMRNEITANCTEKLNNIRFIKSIGTDYEEYREISKTYLTYRNIEIKRYFIEYFGVMMPQFFVLIGLSIILYFILYENELYKSYITIYVLPMGFIGMRCFTYVSQLNNKYMRFKQNLVSSYAISDFWNEHKTFFLFTNKQKNSLVSFPSTIKSIYFDNVFFAYDKQTLIQNFSIRLEKGIPIILKGKSGSGKTTLANLLRMLIEPQRGKIWLNDIPITSFDTVKLRSVIGYVTQEAVMMHGTVLENLLYGSKSNPGQKVIDNVLKETGCYEFISTLPDGIDTMVTEKGSNFSGGQKQRLALARIFLRNPEILILDEITNNLDKESKIDIINAINKLVKNMICLVITHDDDVHFDNEKLVFL